MTRETIGRSHITTVKSRDILTRPSGFMAEYDYTLNPYSGCTFGCTYCYAAFFVRNKEQQETWGKWVAVKENALELLQKRRKKSLRGKSIYMSSVTDPYQPIERELNLTRAILEELLTYHQPRLVIQTRSPIVTRDIDLLQQFEVVQVNMTVTTDDESVRRVFEPVCSSNRARLNAITTIQAAGIPSCITMTPLLPVSDANAFGEQLRATGVERFVIQPFHAEKGRFVAGTRREALDLVRARNWNQESYEAVVRTLQKHLPHLREGKAGFAPIS